MGITKTIKQAFFNKKKKQQKRDNLSLKELASYMGSSNGLDVDEAERSEAFSETVYYICLKRLCETMSKMPWTKRQITRQKGSENMFDTRFDYLLNIKPNPYVTATQFWAAVELNKVHHGNAYVYIEPDACGYPKALWQLPSKEMEVWQKQGGTFGEEDALWYVWNDRNSGKRWSFSMSEIIHVKSWFTFDGLIGIPAKELLRTQFSTRRHSEAFLNKFYKSGMFGSKVMIYYGDTIDKGNEEKVAEHIEKFSSRTANGKFIPLPVGWQAQMLDMKLADAQFFENNKISALHLAAVFGIKPNDINDYTKSSYNNSESQQLDFYVNTLQPLFRSYEQEFMSKLLRDDELAKGMRLEIDTKILFKMDSKTRAEVLTSYLTNFAMTPNEVREELNLPYIPAEAGGDKLVGNGNAITLDRAGEQYK